MVEYLIIVAVAVLPIYLLLWAFRLYAVQLPARLRAYCRRCISPSSGILRRSKHMRLSGGSSCASAWLWWVEWCFSLWY